MWLLRRRSCRWPAAAAAAVIVYRVTGYWTIGATGAAVAAALAAAARPAHCTRTRGTGAAAQLVSRIGARPLLLDLHEARL